MGFPHIVWRSIMERGKIARSYQRERPLLQGVPSFKIVHRTILKFTLCGAHVVFRGRRPRTPASLLKKGQSKTFPFLTGIIAFDIKPQSVERIMVLFSERLQTFRKQNRRPRYVAEIILSSGLEAKADKTLRSMRRA